MKHISLKLLLTLSIILGTNSFAKDCKIMTSPIDLSNMNFGYSSYYISTVPIVTGKTYKYTSFFDAYQDFDKTTKKWIKDNACTKNKWDGVANYKIQWQQTDKMYNFTATYDTFGNK